MTPPTTPPTIVSVGGLPPVEADLWEMGLVTDGLVADGVEVRLDGVWVRLDGVEVRLEVGDNKVELVKIRYERVSGVC